MTCRVLPAAPGSTAARRTSPSGCGPATSPSSTTWTSTGSAPRRCSAARSPRSSTPRPASPAATPTSGRDPGRGRHPAGRRRRPGRVRPAQGGRRGPAGRRHAVRRRRGRGEGHGADRRRRWPRRWPRPRPGCRPARGVRGQHDGVPEAASASCCSTASACPTCAPRSTAGTCWSWSAATTTSEDLAALRPYIREYRPVLIGVDGGADALLEAGYQPDIIVGDMDSVSDRALRCGAEMVVHAYPTAGPPGWPGSSARHGAGASSRPPAPARTSRCCSPTTRAPA